MGDRPRQLKAKASSRNAMGTALLRAALGWGLPWRGLPRVGESDCSASDGFAQNRSDDNYHDGITRISYSHLALARWKWLGNFRKPFKRFP